MTQSTEELMKLPPDERNERNPNLAHLIAVRERDRMRAENPIPPEVRAEVLERAGSRCESCGERLPLELHHETYYVWTPRGPDEWIFGQETPDDLRALCRGCHHDIHRDPAGNYWMDVNEKDVCWETYDKELELG